MFFEYLINNQAEILRMIIQHLFLFSVSTMIAIISGIFISIISTLEGYEKFGRVLLTVSGMAQAVPSIAVVALVFLVVGIGMKPAIIALIIYSIVPIIFNTSSGLLSVNAKTIEAARGVGFTNNQILWKIKMPIASPVIIAGIRSAATINIGTATIASLIGGGGLGDLIFIGIKLQKHHITIIGAVLTALIAIIVDISLQAAGKKIIPRGLAIVTK
ncbi:MAG: ABC transporter permease [Spirochaetales bacterium]|nr:ABC transporter permease [Spirochaetales bacterium]